MSIFNRLPQDVIRRDFTHKGMLLGIVPIYLAASDDDVNLDDPVVVDDVIVCERNWVPEIAVPVAAWIVVSIVWLLNFGGLRPAFPTKFPIIVTGDIT